MTWRQTGTTTERGYGHDHQQERKRWRPIVEAGEAHCHAVICLETSRWIAPDAAWHLGHNAERTAWTGPEHPGCNLSDGGRRGNQRQRGERPRPRPRRPFDW